MLDEYEAVLTVSDLQEILNIGRNYAYELLRDGRIAAFRVGKKWRIPKQSVIDFLSQYKLKNN